MFLPRVVVDKIELKKAIVAMVKKGPSPLDFWTLKIIDQWIQDPRQKIPGIAKERRDSIGELVQEGVLVQKEINHPKRGPIKETTLDTAKATQLGYLR